MIPNKFGATVNFDHKKLKMMLKICFSKVLNKIIRILLIIILINIKK